MSIADVLIYYGNLPPFGLPPFSVISQIRLRYLGDIKENCLNNVGEQVKLMIVYAPHLGMMDWKGEALCSLIGK